MKYSTPAERKLIYQKLIDEIDEGELFFMCTRIRELIRAINMGLREVLPHFPELHLLQPEDLDEEDAWFNDDASGMQERRKCLKAAIKLCK